MMIKWIEGAYTLPKRWARKGQIGQLNPGLRAMRVVFRWEIAWIVCNEHGAAMMPDGSFMRCWSFYLNQFGPVMGARDLQSAANTPMHEAWLAAGQAAIDDEIKLRGAL